MDDRTPRAQTVGLVEQLLREPTELEWLEFKENNSSPDEIGEYISALSNAAAIGGRDWGYVLWGVRDSDGQLVGTRFDPATTKIGNEQLEPWLTRLLDPQIEFAFTTIAYGDVKLVLLRIARAEGRPTKFKKRGFLRVGSYKKPLADHPGHERRLWRALEAASFEFQVAVPDRAADDVLSLLDYPTYFNLMGLPLPSGKAGILEGLAADGLIRRDDAGRWEILAVGGLLFGRELRSLGSLGRKALRVVRYEGNSRVKTIREHELQSGYALAFPAAVRLLRDILPSNEVVSEALRRDTPMYPEVAVRELVANALIHQDLYARGSGPMIEVFESRLEITNPGEPLIDTLRFLDSPPRSRNEGLAALMRRMGMCEERGSGWDKVAFEIELHQLPAPLVRVTDESTRVVLFAHEPLVAMDSEARVRAVYLHACLRYVTHERTTNSSVRARFGIEKHNSAQASRLIAEAVAAGLIKPYDSSASRRHMRYVPFWADFEEQLR